MDAEKQYIDLFNKYEDLLCSNAPEGINSFRRQAFEDFKQLGFPKAKHEDYQYTNVSDIFSREYGLNFKRLSIPVKPDDVFQCDVPNLSSSSYFIINDSFYTSETAKNQLQEGVYAGSIAQFMTAFPEVASRYYGQIALTHDNALTAFNAMFVQDGFVLYVPEGLQVEHPFQLVNIFRSSVDLMANRRILIIIEARAKAKLLVCDHSMDTVRFLGNQVVEIFAEENASFDFYDLEESSLSTSRFSTMYVKQETASNVLINSITLNNGLTRNNFHICLEGEYAETNLCGMAILDKNQHVDVRSHISHTVPHCKSNELFRNILNDSAMGVFNGRVLVKEGADKTVAFQTNRNLSMTREARMYSKPQLEIYADDVKCSHGMSMGQLDEQALFYLRSRGLSYEEARMMLSVAFTSDVIHFIRLDSLKDRLIQLVEKRFRGELARCAACSVCNGK